MDLSSSEVVETPTLPRDSEDSSSSCCEIKWLVLSLTCILPLGSYYIYDFPGSIGTGPSHTIESMFREQGLTYTHEMNQALYSVYSWPNTVLAMVGGLLIDGFFGIRRAMLLFSFLVFTGSMLFAAGVGQANYRWMVLGRIVFGLGGESLSVAQSAFIARWFRDGPGMSLAFGITISCSRVGSSLNFLWSPSIAEQSSVTAAAVAGAGMCSISFSVCVILVLVDVYAVRMGYLKIPSNQQDTVAAGEESGLNTTGDGAEESGRMELKDIQDMPQCYWLLCVVCVFCYTSIFPFIGVAKNFFAVKYGYPSIDAARYVSFFQLSSAVASPFAGWLTDRVGHHALWLVAATSGFVVAHLCFLCTTAPAYAITIFMGCTYSALASGLWPSIPRTVEAHVTAFAYGMMTSLQNIGLALFPTMVGSILDHHRTAPKGLGSSATGDPSLEGFYCVEYLLLASGIVALVASLVVAWTDRRGEGVLWSSGRGLDEQSVSEVVIENSQASLTGECLLDPHARACVASGE